MSLFDNDKDSAMEILKPNDFPWNEEHLQLLSAWYWLVGFFYMRFITMGLLIYLTFFSSYYPVVILYLCWLYYDKETPYKGGRKNWYLQNNKFWKYFNSYFPIKLVKTADLSADNNYLFCYYPHGVIPAGIFGCFSNDWSDFKKLYPGLDAFCATLDFNFHCPIFREYVMAIGGISSSKESMKYVLDEKNKGNTIVIAIGGATESLYSKPGPYRIVLKDRKGFVKLALETGTALVPVFGFGEIDLFQQYNPPGSMVYKFQIKMKKILGYALLWPYGRGLFSSSGFVPLKEPVTVVVGNAVELPKISKPTKEDIEKYHNLFIEALTELFNEHKNKYSKDGDKSELIIE